MSKVAGKRYTYKFDLSSLMQACCQQKGQSTTARNVASSSVFQLPDGDQNGGPSLARTGVIGSECFVTRSNNPYYLHQRTNYHT